MKERIPGIASVESDSIRTCKTQLKISYIRDKVQGFSFSLVEESVIEIL